MTIHHCVFMRFRSDTPAAAREKIHADLLALQSKVDGMLGVTISANVSPEPLGGGFNDGFIVRFRDAAARDAYLVHPDHVALGGAIIAQLEGGAAGILVYDLED